MLRPSEFIRLLYINRVLIKHGLDEIVLAIPIFKPVRFFYYLLPWNWFRRNQRAARSERIRQTLEELGPIFVKLGQIISTRRDLLPPDIADSLAKLQDQVAPFPTPIALQIIESSLQQPIAEVFAEFTAEPLASASIAQVYAATLKTGEQVIVKVIRPDIRKIIQRDTGLMRLIAELAERYSSEARRLRPVEMVSDFETNIFDELDLIREAANANQLRRNFANSDSLYVPQVYWDWTRESVMVMERVNGIAIDDVTQLDALGVDRQKLAERGVEVFFKQVFVDNFFHADMHPGNIFVDIRQPTNPKYIAIDFGIVGTLSDADKRYLAENFLAFFNRDYRRVAQLHLDSGWVPPTVRVGELEMAIRTVCEPNFDRPLKEISFAHVLMRLFQTVRRFDFVIQPQLILLQKTLLNIEGLGRQLYPDLDLWRSAKPFLERAMRREMLFRTLIEQFPGSPPEWLRQLPDLAEQLPEIVRQAAQGQLQLQLQSKDIRILQQQLRINQRSQFWLLSGIALIISAIIWPALNVQTYWNPFGLHLPAWFLGLSGITAITRAWWLGRKA